MAAERASSWLFLMISCRLLVSASCCVSLRTRSDRLIDCVFPCPLITSCSRLSLLMTPRTTGSSLNSFSLVGSRLTASMALRTRGTLASIWKSASLWSSSRHECNSRASFAVFTSSTRFTVSSLSSRFSTSLLLLSVAQASIFEACCGPGSSAKLLAARAAGAAALYGFGFPLPAAFLSRPCSVFKSMVLAMEPIAGIMSTASLLSEDMRQPSAPCFRRSSAARIWPSAAAQCRGVSPLSLNSLISALFAIRYFTASTDPRPAARCSTGKPHGRSNREDPYSSKALTTSILPRMRATAIGFRPSLFVKEGFAPACRRALTVLTPPNTAA
mmetsp:Transcript_37934/g.107182  ORF Transcript_37934/g.107182 Transcript_37934/m.107182 type:complete len:329 (+) Transcript_37934:606-1592(+)